MRLSTLTRSHLRETNLFLALRRLAVLTSTCVSRYVAVTVHTVRRAAGVLAENRSKPNRLASPLLASPPAFVTVPPARLARINRRGGCGGEGAPLMEIFGAPLMLEKMKRPEGSCQFTKSAALSSLPLLRSSAGTATAPSPFHPAL